MSQHDYILDNQNGASFRADINNVLAAIATCNSGATAPATPYAYQLWHDTTTGIIKQRNAANSAWVNLADVLLAGQTVTGNVTVNGLITYTNQLKADTVKNTTSGTNVDFTGIPSWVKRITVMFTGVSTNGSSNIIMQIGAGSVTTTGYLGAAAFTGGGSAGANFTNGFGVATGNAAASVVHGVATLCLMGSNVWAYGINAAYSNTAAGLNGGGSVTLSGTLDRVRITTVAGTDTFDAGSVNILYE